MDGTAMQWLIGIAVSVLVPTVGIVVSAMTRLSTKQSQDTGALHAKIETLQSYVHQNYVRRDDFREFKEDLKERLDKIEDNTEKLLGFQKQH